MANFFSKQDIRGLLVFLPLAAIAIATLLLAQPKNDPAEARRVEQAADTLGFKTQKQKNLTTEPEEKTLKLRPFDPNTVDYEELLEMGLTQKEALSLIQYRAGGKIFRIPEEVDACYGIEHPRYLQIKPYIRIGRRYAKAPAAYRPGRIVKSTIAPEPFRIDTVSGRYLQAIGALTGKQARVFNKYRLINDGIRDMEDFRNCHVVNDSVADALEPYILFPEEETADENRRINLNTADSAELRSVIGIGEKTVQAILEYRERLGGFVRVEQLAEVSGVTESNYEKIAQQIYCDSCEIRKIDINFVAPKELVAHPYINIRNGKTLRKLLHERRLKGGWRTVEELIEDDIMTREEAARLAPYLVFNRNDGTDDSPKRHETETATEDAAPTQKPNESIKNLKKRITMIIMPVKEGENIERALKKFKRKYERTGVLKELRRRQYFTKPSVAKREAMMHAIYVEHMYRDED